MSNETIYPFGQGGSLPSGYPIADDLKTNSAQQALAAKQGVVLKGMMGNVKMVAGESETVAFSISGYYSSNGTITSSTKSDSTPKIPIADLSQVLYTGAMSDLVATWFDASEQVIFQSVNSKGQTLIELDVLKYKPDNAAYVGLSSRNSNADTPPSQTPECTIVHNSSTPITLQSQIDNLNDTPDEFPFPLKGYYNSSGVITSGTTTNSSQLIQLSRYKRLVYTGNGNGILTFFSSNRTSVVRQVAIYDVIGGSSASYDANVSSIDIMLYAPSTAAYVGVTVRNDTYSPAPIVTASLKGYNDHKHKFVEFGVVANGYTDTTDALQDLLYNGGSEISFPRGVYKISSTLIVKPELVKKLVGNGAIIKVTADVPAFKVVGSLTSSSTANPNSLGAKVIDSEGSTVIEGFNIMASSDSIGTGICLSYVFQPIIRNCHIHNINIGISVENTCRNIIIAENNIYCCTSYGVLFANNSDVHQVNMVGNHISYSACCLGFIQTNQTANIQVTGNDIEISSWPTTGRSAQRCVVIDYQNTSSPLFSELEFVGNTIQGHEDSAGLIDISGANGSTASAQNISFAGNHISNTNGYAVKLSNVHNIAFSGNTYRNIGGKVYEFESTVNGFVASGDICDAGTGFANADENAVIREVTLNGLSGRGMSGGITLSCDTINGVNVSGCNIDSSNITISASTIDYVSVTSNILRGTYTIGTCTHRVVENNL